MNMSPKIFKMSVNDKVSVMDVFETKLKSAIKVIVWLACAVSVNAYSCEKFEYGSELESAVKKIGTLQSAFTKIDAVGGIYVKKKVFRYSVLNPGFDVSADSVGFARWKVFRIDSIGNVISNSVQRSIWLTRSNRMISIGYEYPTHYRNSALESWISLRSKKVKNDFLSMVCDFADNDDHPSLVDMSVARMKGGSWPIIMPSRVVDSVEGGLQSRYLNGDLELRAISIIGNDDSLLLSMKRDGREERYGVGVKRTCKPIGGNDSLCVQRIAGQNENEID